MTLKSLFTLLSLMTVCSTAAVTAVSETTNDSNTTLRTHEDIGVVNLGLTWSEMNIKSEDDKDSNGDVIYRDVLGNILTAEDLEQLDIVGGVVYITSDLAGSIAAGSAAEASTAYEEIIIYSGEDQYIHSGDADADTGGLSFKSSALAITPTSVPEPTAGVLIGLGTLVILSRRGR